MSLLKKKFRESLILRRRKEKMNQFVEDICSVYKNEWVQDLFTKYEGGYFLCGSRVDFKIVIEKMIMIKPKALLVAFKKEFYNEFNKRKEKGTLVYNKCYSDSGLHYPKKILPIKYTPPEDDIQKEIYMEPETTGDNDGFAKFNIPFKHYPYNFDITVPKCDVKLPPIHAFERYNNAEEYKPVEGRITINDDTIEESIGNNDSDNGEDD